MNWTPTRFPAPMRSLNPSTRAKAIEIANSLMQHGNMDRQEAIQISIVEARRQAKVSRLETPLSTAYQRQQTQAN